MKGRVRSLRERESCCEANSDRGTQNQGHDQAPLLVAVNIQRACVCDVHECLHARFAQRREREGERYLDSGCQCLPSLDAAMAAGDVSLSLSHSRSMQTACKSLDLRIHSDISLLSAATLKRLSCFMSRLRPGARHQTRLPSAYPFAV